MTPNGILERMDIPDEFDGNAFLDLIAGNEARCLNRTLERLPDLGVKAPACWEALGMVLAMLDCAAACHWGCAHGDHRLEFLTGRAVNNAYAGLMLMKAGYYDQALLMARSLGETANLLCLFTGNRKEIERWKTLVEKDRRREFSPVKVRLRLTTMKAPLVTDEKRYANLSSYSVHADPNSLPQAHNRRGQAVTAPLYQEAGFLLCLNEIAMPSAFLAVFVARLVQVPKNVSNNMQELGKLLIEQLGGIDVMAEGRPWFKLD